MTESKKVHIVTEIADSWLDHELSICWDVMAKVSKSDAKC